MSYPQNDSRRRHDLVQTVETVSNAIAPFEIDVAHIHTVSETKLPVNVPPKMHGDLALITPTQNYRVMIELHDPRPGKHASWKLANDFIALIHSHAGAAKNRRMMDFVNTEGQTVQILDPIEHNFRAGIGRKNGTAEQILNLERDPNATGAPKIKVIQPKSKKALQKLVHERIDIGLSLRKYFDGRDFDFKNAEKLGDAISGLNVRGFSADELFNIVYSIEKRVHRKFKTNDVIDTAKSIAYFSDQKYSHDDCLRLARVAATIRGPVIVLRGNFQNKKELLDFVNSTIASAIEDMNKIAKDPNAKSKLDRDRPAITSRTLSSELSHVVSFASQRLGNASTYLGRNLRTSVPPNVPGANLLWKPPLALGKGLQNFAKSIQPGNGASR